MRRGRSRRGSRTPAHQQAVSSLAREGMVQSWIIVCTVQACIGLFSSVSVRQQFVRLAELPEGRSGEKRKMTAKYPARTNSGPPLACLADEEATGGVRLFVVSGVRLMREGIARSVRARRRTDVALVGCASFSEIERAAPADLRPDVVLVDLAGLQAANAAASLRLRFPDAKLVAFSVLDAIEDVFACAAAGFAGYVTREEGVDDLLRDVLAVHDGRMTCSPHISAAMFARLAGVMRGQDLDLGASVLTARERQVIGLANEGCSNKEIGRRLRISPSTVKNHIHSALQKLQVERRGQAAARLLTAAGATRG